MHRTLPPLNPLRVFEAAARHIHFTRAAEELGITQAAVSRQISTLEQWLDVKLFERHHNGLSLTTAGSQYLESLRPAFDIVSESTSRMLAKSIQSKIVMRSFATFALMWLMPRLARFREEHPDIQIDLLISVASIEMQREQADLIVTYADSEPEDGVARRLFPDVIVPVCSPRLLNPDAPVSSAADLRRFTLLHSRYRPDDWHDWISYAGDGLVASPGIIFGSSTLTYQAAKEGLGLAMGQVRFLGAELASGSLVIPFDKRLERNASYFLVHSKRATHDERVTILRDWIVNEARQPFYPATSPTG